MVGTESGFSIPEGLAAAQRCVDTEFSQADRQFPPAFDHNAHSGMSGCDGREQGISLNCGPTRRERMIWVRASGWFRASLNCTLIKTEGV
jgi:hypothetical protein